MKKVLKNIAVGFLLVIMLIATMGFSVNTLYCLCMGELETSVFEIDHHCKKQHQSEEEYTPKHACCKKMMACQPKKDNHDCTKKTKKFFKADLKYLETEKVKLPEFTFVTVLPKQLKIENFGLKLVIQNPKSEILYRPPPQLYGRALLNFIQVYRC